LPRPRRCSLSRPPSLLHTSTPPPPPIRTIFPYTTLFRSSELDLVLVDDALMRTEFNQCYQTYTTVLARPGQAVELQATFASEDIDRRSTRLNSSHASISYADSCLRKKNDRR